MPAVAIDPINKSKAVTSVATMAADSFCDCNQRFQITLFLSTVESGKCSRLPRPKTGMHCYPQIFFLFNRILVCALLLRP